jgi:cell division protein FtsL
VLVSSLIVGALLVAIVATQALVSQTSFHMRDLQAKAKALRQVNAQLTLQVANLSAPDRIVAEARALGMGLPNSAAVQVLRPAANAPSHGSAPEGGAASRAGGSP